MLRANETELLGGPETETDGVLDAEGGEAECDVEDGDRSRAIIVDTLLDTDIWVNTR